MRIIVPQTRGAARVIDAVNIPQKGFMEDMVYFPRSSMGIKGKRLRLRLDIPGLEKPFEGALCALMSSFNHDVSDS